ncbi:MAG: aminoacyl-tRNA deacylase [Myxococcales bacterium]
MIPQRIVDYLEQHAVPYERRLHRRAITAQELAATVHVPGRRVAKSVLVEAGGKVFIAVLPAIENVDVERLARVLGVPQARLLHETEFESLFPDCEPGAEPPFGGLYGLPVVIDSALAEVNRIIFRAGSHEEAIELRYADFFRLENEPVVGAFGRPRPLPRPLWTQDPATA